MARVVSTTPFKILPPYSAGYKYGSTGKFPKPEGHTEEWNQGYDDGRADFLNSINPKSEWKQY